MGWENVWGLIEKFTETTYLTVSNLTPISASRGFDFRHSLTSSVTSLVFFFTPLVSKWQAICWDTSSRTRSGLGIIAHGLRADPLSKMARWARPTRKKGVRCVEGICWIFHHFALRGSNKSSYTVIYCCHDKYLFWNDK